MTPSNPPVSRTFPYKAWVLMPSFKPKEVEMVRAYESYSRQDYGDLTGAGKLYARPDIFGSKREAIEEGWRRVDKQKADLDKKLVNIVKKRRALMTATGELSKESS